MKAHVSLYPTARTEITGHWMSPRPPGWTAEGGWVAFRDEFGPGWDPDGGFVIYLDREQALRLRRVIDELVDRLPDPTGPEGVEVNVP